MWCILILWVFDVCVFMMLYPEIVLNCFSLIKAESTIAVRTVFMLKRSIYYRTHLVASSRIPYIIIPQITRLKHIITTVRFLWPHHRKKDTDKNTKIFTYHIKDNNILELFLTVLIAILAKMLFFPSGLNRIILRDWEWDVRFGRRPIVQWSLRRSSSQSNGRTPSMDQLNINTPLEIRFNMNLIQKSRRRSGKFAFFVSYIWFVLGLAHQKVIKSKSIKPNTYKGNPSLSQTSPWVSNLIEIKYILVSINDLFLLFSSDFTIHCWSPAKHI